MYGWEMLVKWLLIAQSQMLVHKMNVEWIAYYYCGK